MNLKALFFGLLLSASFCSYSQDSTFNINLPAGWTLIKKKDLYNAVQRDSTLSKQVKQEILAHVPVQQSFTYAAPAKADSQYRPVIQMLVIRNDTKSFSAFRLMIENSIEENKAGLKEMKILEPVSEITIGGRRSLYAKTTGSLPTKTDGKTQLFSRIYAIPNGQYFYHITMNDSTEDSWEEAFKKVLSQLRL